MSNAESCKIWREKQKKNPGYKKLEAERKKLSRAQRTPKQIEHDKQLSRARSSEYRKRQKERGGGCKDATTTKKEKPLTRLQLDRKRKRDREYKSKYRQGLSVQKKRRIREKDTNAHRSKRKNTKPSSSSEENNNEFYSKDAKYKAIQRTRKSMPKDAEKYVQVLEGLEKNVTPRKRKLLQERGRPSPKRRKMMMESFGVMKKSTCWPSSTQKLSERARKNRKQIMCKIAKSLKQKRLLRAFHRQSKGISWNYLTACANIDMNDSDCDLRKKRNDALTEEEIKDVKDFYILPHISTTLASRKTVNKALEQKNVMNMSLDDAHKEYSNRDDTKKISVSKFMKLRPKNVLTVSRAKFRGCLCEYCTNIDFKRTALNKFIVAHHQKFHSKFDMNGATLCNSSKLKWKYKRNCLKRKCMRCGISKFRRKMQPFVVASSNVIMTWNKWECIDTEVKGHMVSRMMLREHKGTLQELVDETASELQSYAEHLFCAKWQHQQFTELRIKPPDHAVVCVLDFSENYACDVQDAVQTHHWGKQQITLHPIVCYYNTTDGVCQHDIIVLTDDRKHDAHAVQKLTEVLVTHLNKTVEFDTLYEFTDGCSAQY